MKLILRWILVFFMAMLLSQKTWASGSHLIVQLPWDHQFQFAGFYQALRQGYYTDVISVNRNRPQKDPILVEKFLQATLRGWKYALNNKEKTINKIVKLLPKKYQMADIAELNRHFAAHFQQLSRYPQVPLGSNDPERWVRMHSALKRIGTASNNSKMQRQLFTPTASSENQYNWLLITLLFSSLAAVTLLAGWAGQRRPGYFAPLISVIFILIIIYFTVTLYREQEIENQKQEALIKLSKVRVQLEESINSTIFLIKGLIAYIRLNPDLTQHEFELVARQLVDDHPMIRNIGAAPDFIIRMIYPLKKNQQALGLNYRDLPDQWPSALKAKETNQVVLAGPQKLVQGGVGLIGRLPVYIQNEAGYHFFWGLVSTVLHADVFYRTAGLYDPNLGLVFAIRGKNGKGDNGEVFFGDEELFHHERSVTMNIMIPGGFWQIAARPADDWKKSSTPVLLIYLLGSISVLLAIISYYIRRSHEYQRRKNELHISYLAYHDSLTGLPNRTQFTEELNRVLAHAKRSGNTIAVLLLDLDHFKQINDTLGHAAGDEILKEVSQRLKKRIRKEDHVARLGGDEFAIIQRDLKATDDAITFAQELIISLSQPYYIRKTRLQSGASIGIAIWRPGEEIDANLLEEADIALYKAKDKGRGNYAFHTNEMTHEIQHRVDLRNELEKALNADTLFLVYQPQIDIRENKLIGVEALLRWKHPTQGLISPAEFIPIAETHGMMHRLGFYVLKTACEALIRWRNKGLFQKVMAVNISPGQMNNETFDQELIELIDQIGLPGDALELEVTERMMIQPRPHNTRILNALTTKGIKLAMDDFGTGYSSLLTLKHWPFRRLKIDQAFVRGMLTDPNDREIIRATIGLAENLGLEVLAEGVEEAEQLTFLKQNGCYLIQGSLLANPMPEDDLIEWIRKNYANKLTTPSRPT